VPDFIAVIFQRAPQDVFKQVSAHIAQVRVPINGWAASVKTDPARAERFESFFFPGKGIKKFYSHFFFLKTITISKTVSSIRPAIFQSSKPPPSSTFMLKKLAMKVSEKSKMEKKVRVCITWLI